MLRCRGFARPTVPSAVLAALALGAGGQTPALAFPDAVQAAVARYPGVEAARQGLARAQAEAGVAATNLLPNLGLAGQWDRATDNATLGLSFPSPLPSISGTVPAKDYAPTSAFTSAAGAYFSWEVADFGRRAANILYYRDLAAAAGAQVDLARLQVGAHAGDAFLTVLASQQQLGVAQADVGRWQQIAAIIQALVDQQLRPGADASRAQAELAGARIRQSNAERNLAIAQANLAEALNWSGGLPALLPLPAAPAPGPVPSPALHPELRAEESVVAAAQARTQELARSALPRWFVLGSAYGRGSGVLAAGSFAGGASGLAPTTAGNWGAGLGVDFSFTRWRTTAQQQTAARAQLEQETARRQQVASSLDAAGKRAAADLAAARAVAAQAPIELEAATASEAQARVRYQSGLAGVVDLANAEQLLAQAQSDEALSRLQVWRGLLETAFAAGDLQPLVRAASGGH